MVDHSRYGRQRVKHRVITAMAVLAGLIGTGAMAAGDPTAPLGWQQPAGSQPVGQGSKPAKLRRAPLPSVQSIVCNDSGDCHAVLNNRVVSGGDKVAGYRIKKITPQGVRVTRAGREWTLRLFSLSIKQ